MIKLAGNCVSLSCNVTSGSLQCLPAFETFGKPQEGGNGAGGGYDVKKTLTY
ncbi:hypothetical protein BgiBS90_022715, partial [Biomphalaria glabrata]